MRYHVDGIAIIVFLPIGECADTVSFAYSARLPHQWYPCARGIFLPGRGFMSHNGPHNPSIDLLSRNKSEKAITKSHWGNAACRAFFAASEFDCERLYGCILPSAYCADIVSTVHQSNNLIRIKNCIFDIFKSSPGKILFGILKKPRLITSLGFDPIT